MKNSSLVYHPTLLNNNLSIMNLNIIVLIYGLFYYSSVGNGVWGLGGGVGDWVSDGCWGGGVNFIKENPLKKFLKDFLYKIFIKGFPL